MMSSSQTITLFTQQTESSRRPFSFVVSTAMHAATVGLLYWGIIGTPQVRNRLAGPQYPVQHLDMHTPEPLVRRSAGSSNFYPRQQAAAQAGTPGNQPAAAAAALREIAHRKPAPQTLVRPDLPADLILPQETPVPSVLLWSAKNTPVTKVVPPQPHEPTAANVTPSLDPPNEEVNVADLGIASSDLSKTHQPLLPSTTSPVVVQAPELKAHVPETTTKTAEPPTPAAAMSVSDLHVREGTITLPPANETAPAPAAQAQGNGKSGNSSLSGNGKSGNSSQAGNGNSGSGGKDSGTGAGKGAGNTGKTSSPAPAPTGGTAAQNAHDAGPAQNASNNKPAPGAPNGSSQGTASASATHITLPKDGQFGVVVVGSSMAEEYPETAELWSGRMAYTVYLHVGMRKNWILQYSLPRADEAAAAGSIAHLEAPWPYNIVRPNIAPDEVNADALMIRGFVNEAGRFEGLAVVFPQDFALVQLVLNSLEQWQFRPALQNGRAVKVEVLLIVPEED
jgi:uncharacterized membrane protein YgcG